ncbi:MAG: hypothetical protein MI702_10570, partial [Chlorobiales bacterium]|nr:hypothetical protein [Chlorobiales bacterium]
ESPMNRLNRIKSATMCFMAEQGISVKSQHVFVLIRGNAYKIVHVNSSMHPGCRLQLAIT